MRCQTRSGNETRTPSVGWSGPGRRGPLGSEPSRPSGRGREPLRRVFSKQIPELLFGIRRCLWSLGALPVATGELGMLLDVGRRPDVV